MISRKVKVGAFLVALAVAAVAYATSFVTVAVNDGTQALPSFTFNSDGDTGFFRSGSGTVHYSANNTDVMTLAPTGVTIPSLTVSSCTGCGALSQTVSTVALTFTDCCTGNLTQTLSYVQTGSTVTMRIQASTGTGTADSANFATAAGDIPAAIRPAAQVTINGMTCQDAGLTVNCGVQILTDGTYRYCLSGTAVNTCAAGNWTNSGNRIMAVGGSNGQTVFSYPLN